MWQVFLLICAFCTSNCLIEEIYAFISLTWCKVYKYIGKNNLFFRKKRSGQIGSFWAVLKYLKFCWSILLLRVFFHVFMSKTSTNLVFLHIKTVAFITGKKNPAILKNFIRFSIEIKLKKLFQRWDSIQNLI